jgi:hypothetical protein
LPASNDIHVLEDEIESSSRPHRDKAPAAS